jgi:hypothetical protein
MPKKILSKIGAARAIGKKRQHLDILLKQKRVEKPQYVDEKGRPYWVGPPKIKPVPMGRPPKKKPKKR